MHLPPVVQEWILRRLTGLPKENEIRGPYASVVLRLLREFAALQPDEDKVLTLRLRSFRGNEAKTFVRETSHTCPKSTLCIFTNLPENIEESEVDHIVDEFERFAPRIIRTALKV